MGTVEEVLKAFRKYGIIASAKKLVMGNSIEFGDAVIKGNSQGVSIIPNVARLEAMVNIRRPTTRKEVQIYLGTVKSLIKWFPGLNTSTPNIGASIIKGRVFK